MVKRRDYLVVLLVIALSLADITVTPAATVSRAALLVRTDVIVVQLNVRRERRVNRNDESRSRRNGWCVANTRDCVVADHVAVTDVQDSGLVPLDERSDVVAADVGDRVIRDGVVVDYLPLE